MKGTIPNLAVISTLLNETNYLIFDLLKLNTVTKKNCI
jgi:hypothetical protein